MLKGLRSVGLAAFLAVASMGYAQSGSQGVMLKSHIPQATFGASAGNDCWGYTSPSGREYAIMGLNNQVAFVEVTQAENPVIVETIPHSSSGWGDIKVYGTTAYAVTETQGTGLQVIDMSDIDNGNVILVQTINDFSRAHNLALDTTSGFLYTCGTRGGTGTTMCYDLTDPLNPVQVGQPSLTLNYSHDAQVFTYPSGPLAGRQIMFSFSEGRGVDIYDVTDKNATPTIIKRLEYPDIGYCHQGWMSEDMKYLYVDDEFDENNGNIDTRSLVFNIESMLTDFADPYGGTYFVGTFSSHLHTIDHNQYVDDGFIFQANYQSGLQIFDQGSNPIVPFKTGWYDTFVGGDEIGFDGAWSTYPFFPSGTVIISDIDGGLFIFDCSEALTRTTIPSAFNLTVGAVQSGGAGQFAVSDNQYLTLGMGGNSNTSRSFIQFDVSATAFDFSPNKISVQLESKANTSGYNQVIELFNWSTGEYEVIDDAPIQTEQNIEVSPTGDMSRFVNPVTKQVKVQIRVRQVMTNVSRIVYSVDQLKIKILR